MNKGLIGIFEGMTKNQKTQMGVARSQVYFTQRGYICHPTPPDCQCDWDIVIAKRFEEPLKVQVGYMQSPTETVHSCRLEKMESYSPHLMEYLGLEESRAMR